MKITHCFVIVNRDTSDIQYIISPRLEISSKVKKKKVSHFWWEGGRWIWHE